MRSVKAAHVKVWYYMSMKGIPSSWALRNEWLCLYSVAQSHLTLCDPKNCSPPGSNVHGISQARILEWVTITYSRRTSWPRDRTQVSCISCIGRQILYHWCQLFAIYISLMKCLLRSLAYFLFIYFCCMACGFLIPWPKTEPRPLAVKAQSPNHWTAREFPGSLAYF